MKKPKKLKRDIVIRIRRDQFGAYMVFRAVRMLKYICGMDKQEAIDAVNEAMAAGGDVPAETYLAKTDDPTDGWRVSLEVEG